MRNKDWLTELLAWIILIAIVLVSAFIINALVNAIGPVYVLLILILIYGICC